MKTQIKFTIFLTTIALSACTSSVQTSSGADYNKSVPTGEKALRQAAGVEPLLQFPANFCVVKTNETKMIYSEPAEMQIWNEKATNHPEWGSFREINPAVINLVVAEKGNRWNGGEAGANEIRLGAARQHCDAVLTYETRKGQGGVAATALLFDVRNGYSYITANETGKTTIEATQNLAQSVESAMASLQKSL